MQTKDEFLKQRGVPQALIDKLSEEKVNHVDT